MLSWCIYNHLCSDQIAIWPAQDTLSVNMVLAACLSKPFGSQFLHLFDVMVQENILIITGQIDMKFVIDHRAPRGWFLIIFVTLWPFVQHRH